MIVRDWVKPKYNCLVVAIETHLPVPCAHGLTDRDYV